MILTLKLEKREPYRDAFLLEKSLKIDIYAERFALTALFSCKNEIFSSADRAFYKNAQILTPVRKRYRNNNKSIITLKRSLF